ncbi:MAG TPA: cobalamin-binding protein [Candidatus Bilamarchaeum sp.]|nr:cobalamin-binding protein [Candidatus Bilamarchaeum sp.]
MRIVSLAPSNTEILFAIGAGGDVVGRTAYCDFPREALGIPKIGDYVNPEPSLIKSLNPDLVLTSTIVQEKLAARLMEAGLPVTHFDPRTLNGVFESVMQIGELVGRRGGAEGVIRGMEDGFHSLMDCPAGKKPRLYIEEWHEPPFVSGNWVPKIAAIAGADYPLALEGQLSREIPLEEIKEFDPEIIVLSICGVRAGPDLVQKRRGWEGISAVRAGRVYAMDDSLLNRPGPRLVEGARQLKKLISSSLQTSC